MIHPITRLPEGRLTICQKFGLFQSRHEPLDSQETPLSAPVAQFDFQLLRSSGQKEPAAGRFRLRSVVIRL